MKTPYNVQRRNMMDCQIKPFSVIDTAVLDAFSVVPREEFVPSELKNRAYLDEDLPVGQGRYLLEPAAYARLLQEAGVSKADRVLEIGCLTGYGTAVLAHLAAHVTAVDTESWAMLATKNLSDIENVTVFSANLTEGLSEKAPYDLIVINGALQILPEVLVDQLADGGRIACFWRERNAQTTAGKGQATVFTKQEGRLSKRDLFDAFVPLLPGFESVSEFAL